MKKIILIFMFMFVFFVSGVSATDWDNKDDYSEDNMTVIITNWFGLGEELGRATLTSHQAYDEVLTIMPGENRAVMIYEFKEWEDGYGGGLGDVKFTDLDTDREIKRNYYFGIPIYEDVVIPIRQEICDNNPDKNETSYCGLETIGHITERRIVNWEKLDNSDIPKGTNIIGLITDVYIGDKIDGVWKIAGKKVSRHASWTSALDEELMNYWSFDESSGTAVPDLSLNENNGTTQNMEDGDWVLGLQGNALDFDGADEWVNSTKDLDLPTNWSINLWINPDAFDGSDAGLFQKIGDAGSYNYMAFLDGATNEFTTFGTGQHDYGFTVPTGSYTMITMVYNNHTAEIEVFKNGTSQGSLAWENVVSTQPFKLNSVADDPTKSINGQMDELGMWNRTLSQAEITQLYNDGAGISFGGAPILTLNTPPDAITTPNSSLIFNCSSESLLGILNLTLLIDDVIDQTIVNTTAFQNLSIESDLLTTLGEHNWTCKTSNTNDQVSSTRTFTIILFETIEQTFNSSVYETDTQDIAINISYDSSGFTSISSTLWYNGTSYAGTQTGTADNLLFSRTIDIPLFSDVTNNTFRWEIITNSASSNSTDTNQSSFPLFFNFCNSTNNVSFINYTFINETLAQESVTASISYISTFWLGSGTLNKSVNFINATENPSYAFCSSKNDSSINIVSTTSYANSESQQRRFGQTSILTNLSAIQKLYLLPTINGLFSQFVVTRQNGDPIPNAVGTISRTISGSDVIVASDSADDSGFVSFFLNPDISYSAVFTAVGFNAVSFSFTPTTDTRTVLMGGGVEGVANGTQIGYNLSYQITPTNGALQNSTDITFGFNVSSGGVATLISLNITNQSGQQIAFTSNAGDAFITSVANTQNNSRIVGYYTIQTPNETLSFSKVWTVAVEFIGDYSLNRQMTLFLEYDFSQFARLLIVAIIIMSVLVFMSVGEITDTSESKVAIVFVLVWIFSILGWLDTGLVVQSTTENLQRLGEFSSQFGIAILTTGLAAFFWLRRIFIRRI